MAPQEQKPDFGFMMNEQPPAKRGLSLPTLNLPRPLRITVMAVGGIIVLIIIYSVLSGRGGGSTTAIAGVLARGHETLRVTQLVQQQLQLQDPQTQALAATVSNSLTSDQVQLKSYLARNHATLSTAELVADTDKSTDASMQTALQANNLDSAYVSYLKDALTRYETDLQKAYKLAGPNGKKLLSSSYDGIQTLLSSAPLKS